MKKWSLRVLILALLSAALVLAQRTLFRADPVSVRVVAIDRGDVESTVTNSRAGTIGVRRRAKLSPQLGGRVAELPYREGQTVKQGDLLLRLEGSVESAQVLLALRQVESAAARQAEICLASRRAEQELVRNRGLAERNIISEDQLEKYVSQRDLALLACDSAKAMVLEAEAAHALALARLHQNELRAPFDGILAELDVEVGEYVTPSPPGVSLPTLIDLIDQRSAYISAPMDEVDSALIALDMVVRVTIDPFPGKEFKGRVVRIAPYVLDLEKQNRTIEIEVELEDQEFSSRLLPGTSADVEVILKVAEDVLRVPTSALLEGGRVLLFEEGELVERKVQVGVRNWNWCQVIEGLQVGELVVTSLSNEAVQAGAYAVLEKEP